MYPWRDQPKENNSTWEIFMSLAVFSLLEAGKWNSIYMGTDRITTMDQNSTESPLDNTSFSY